MRAFTTSLFRPAAGWVACLALSLIGCAHTGASTPDVAVVTEAEEEIPADEVLEDGVHVERRDVNGDGAYDLWRWLAPARTRPGQPERLWLVRQHLDLNFDGRADVERTYRDGEVFEERADRDFDGVWESTTLYREGRRVVRYVDRDGDGTIEEERRYGPHGLATIERDETGDGEPDRWSYYREGALQRSGDDVDGDGAADRWVSRTPSPEPNP